MNFFLGYNTSRTKIFWIAFFVFLIILPFGVAYAAEFESETEEKQKIVEGPVENFWDRYHSYIVNSIHVPVVWFDNFFGDPRTGPEDLPISYLRLRTTVRYTEGEGFTFPVRVRASVRLPNASRRLRLVVLGENTAEAQQNQLDSSIPNTITSQEDERNTRVGLRYSIYKTMRDKFHVGGGIKVRWPLDYYVRMRYSRLIHIGSKNIIRFTENVAWHSIEGFASTTTFDFERSFSKTLSNRFTVFGTYSATSNGIDWGIEDSIYKQISQKSAISLDLGAYGETWPDRKVNTYRIGSRFRKNFLRPWLFFEIEPEVRFPLDEYDVRDAIGAITFVLEVQFYSVDKPTSVKSNEPLINTPQESGVSIRDTDKSEEIIGDD